VEKLFFDHKNYWYLIPVLEIDLILGFSVTLLLLKSLVVTH